MQIMIVIRTNKADSMGEGLPEQIVDVCLCFAIELHEHNR